MCQMRIVLKKEGREQVVLENAAALKVTREGVLVNALFEEPKLVPGAALSSIDFLCGTVILSQKGTSRKGAASREA